jgi:putative transposase
VNPAKCDDLDYIQFMIAAQRVFTCTEAARCQPQEAKAPSHDAFTRLLTRQPPDTEALWQETRGLVNLKAGLLVLDDTTLDKPYAKNIQLVTRHWSGKHHQVVLGINLISLLWTDGEALIPTDFRVYDKPVGGKNKNQHFRDMLAAAQCRGFHPNYVLFDSWYSSLDNLKRVRSYGWWWLTQLKSNRQVNPDGSGNVAISTLEIGTEGRQVHLKGYGFIKVFRTVSPKGDAEYWATNNLDLDSSQYEQLSKEAWAIESYHRGIKQCCGVEKAQVRSAVAQIRHISFSIRAFVRLEVHRFKTGVSWYEAKTTIIRDAIRQYMAQPLYLLNSTA